MVTKRRKADVLPAAQSKDEAIGLLARYAALAASIDARNGRVTAAIASMKAQADTLNAPEEAEQKAIFLQLKPWWAVAGDDITEGKRKSIELGGCVIGERMSNPALGYPKPETVAVQLLQREGWQGLLRVKVELDKPAIMTAIRMLDAAPATDDDIDITYARRRFSAWGFSIVQKEEFFIDRLPPKGETVEVVADPAAAQALQVAA